MRLGDSSEEGVCRRISIQYGTDFVGDDRILWDATKGWNQTQIHDYLWKNNVMDIRPAHFQPFRRKLETADSFYSTHCWGHSTPGYYGRSTTCWSSVDTLLVPFYPHFFDPKNGEPRTPNALKLFRRTRMLRWTSMGPNQQVSFRYLFKHFWSEMLNLHSPILGNLIS